MVVSCDEISGCLPFCFFLAGGMRLQAVTWTGSRSHRRLRWNVDTERPKSGNAILTSRTTAKRRHGAPPPDTSPLPQNKATRVRPLRRKPTRTTSLGLGHIVSNLDALALPCWRLWSSVMSRAISDACTERDLRRTNKSYARRLASRNSSKHRTSRMSQAQRTTCFEARQRRA